MPVGAALSDRNQSRTRSSKSLKGEVARQQHQKRVSRRPDQERNITGRRSSHSMAQQPGGSGEQQRQSSVAFSSSSSCRMARKLTQAALAAVLDASAAAELHRGLLSRLLGNRVICTCAKSKVSRPATDSA